MQNFLSVLEGDGVPFLDLGTVGEVVKQVADDPGVLPVVVELGLEDRLLVFPDDIVTPFGRRTESFVCNKIPVESLFYKLMIIITLYVSS